MACGASAYAADRPAGLGLGVVLGSPTGLTMKYYLSPIHAFDLGIASDGDTNLYADYLWHGWNTFAQPDKGRLGAYLGLGAAIRNHHDSELALRTVGGASYWFAGAPLEAFFELVPTFPLVHSGGMDLNAGLGIRYYFQAFN